MALLFWLSLFAICDELARDNFPAPAPTALYSFIMLMSALFYNPLQRAVIQTHPDIQKSIGSNVKGLISIGSGALATLFAFFNPWISVALVLLLIPMWFVPDRRICHASRSFSLILML